MIYFSSWQATVFARPFQMYKHLFLSEQHLMQLSLLWVVYWLWKGINSLNIKPISPQKNTLCTRNVHGARWRALVSEHSSRNLFLTSDQVGYWSISVINKSNTVLVHKTNIIKKKINLCTSQLSVEIHWSSCPEWLYFLFYWAVKANPLIYTH